MIFKSAKYKVVYIVTLSVIFLTTSLQANNKQENQEMVESIIKLRSDVQNLYTTAKENKQSYHAQMKSLSMQITDSEAQINRKLTSIKLADSELNKIKTKILETSDENADIKPFVLHSLSLLENSIKKGIPFMVEQRVAGLRKIRSDLEAGHITNEKALALTWASYDDTIRVTKEIGLFKQEIMFKEKKVLAKIAKIGSIALFFSTPTNEVGFVQKSGDGYNYKHITDPQDIKKIVALFDALQKHIRTGFFQLPNALVLQGSNKWNTLPSYFYLQLVQLTQ